MTDCTFTEFETPREDRKRRVRCGQCGQLSGWTAQPLYKIHANCRMAEQLPDPGRELAKLIKELGVKIDCKACSELAYKMRVWGVDGCREHRSELVKEISSRLGDVSWFTRIAAATRAAFTFNIDLLDPVGSLVDEAIRRAEASTPSASV